jgi:hypothetical protein
LESRVTNCSFNLDAHQINVLYSHCQRMHGSISYIEPDVVLAPHFRISIFKGKDGFLHFSGPLI